MTPILTTPERLILRSRPWVLGLLLIAGIVIFAGISMSEIVAGNDEAAKGPLIVLALFGVVFAVFVRQEVVILDRDADAVVIRVASIFGTRERRHPLLGCKRALVEKDRNDSTDSKTPTFRPVMEYQDGTKVPLTEIYKGGKGAEVATKAINAWLRPRKG